VRELAGRVAVVTGAASGIGLAVAERFAREGMKVVLADVEEEALELAVQRLRQQEHDVIGVRTDVSRYEEVEALARRAVEAYGKVHVLCNNAGVGAGGGAYMWEHSLKDWEWTFAVNLWGVVYGIKAFLPLMLEHGEEGHVVNTASIAGITGGAHLEIYGATKHAVVRLSEALYLQLREIDAKVSASVLCPGYVRTAIFASVRNRPDEMWDGAAARPSAEELERRLREAHERVAPAGLIEPGEVAERVLEAVREDRFWILTHEQFDDAVRRRYEGILERRNPVLQPPLFGRDGRSRAGEFGTGATRLRGMTGRFVRRMAAEAKPQAERGARAAAKRARAAARAARPGVERAGAQTGAAAKAARPRARRAAGQAREFVRTHPDELRRAGGFGARIAVTRLVPLVPLPLLLRPIVGAITQEFWGVRPVPGRKGARRKPRTPGPDRPSDATPPAEER
jgi:NAD(P)-dependent dehydrogenase (short-subunit alcohol dehydrogenase family)